MTTLLRVTNLTHGFGGAAPVLGPVSLDVARGELLVVVGPSGAGKSTLLRVLAGLETPAAGTITWPDGAGGIGVVFQEPRLMPWLDVRANVGFGLRDTAAARRARVDALLALVGLADAGDTLPKRLSGGMAQRVALARGLAGAPALLLLDEPFGALDPANRSHLQVHLKALQAELGTTMVLVTHDIAEAVRLGDRILVLGGRPGRIVHMFDGVPAAAAEGDISRLRDALRRVLGAKAQVPAAAPA